jgi:hypothetical protein
MTQKLERDRLNRLKRERKANRQFVLGAVMLATIFVTPLAVAALLS